MSDIQTSLQVPSGLTAINVIKFEDWLQLTVFADHAITYNATNETQLRILAKMQPGDPIPDDVKKTVQLYQRLDGACKDWIYKIVPGTNEVAREVIRHRDDCTGLYKLVEDTIVGAMPGLSLAEAKHALSEQFKSANPSAPAQAARQQIARIIGRVLGEAGRRQGQAQQQHLAMQGFQGELMACNKELLLQSKTYTDHYGEESEHVKTLRAEVDKINRELTPLRKKEADEVLALETAPLYLLIPWPFGQIIMAGVLLGVGSDLAVIRKRITDLLGPLTQKSAELKTDEVFFQYHGWAMKATDDSAKQVEKTVGALERISSAWTSITSDLTDLHDRLLNTASQDALAGDWDFAKLDLDAAQTEWGRLAAECAGYLQHQLQTGGGTKDLDTAMQGIVVKAA